MQSPFLFVWLCLYMIQFLSMVVDIVIDTHISVAAVMALKQCLIYVLPL
jgi:hypothetical protein